MTPPHRQLARSLVAACGSAALMAGCLPAETSVDGRLLVAGRQIEKPAFLTVDGRATVIFEQRTAYPAAGKSGAASLWTVGWDDGVARLMMANKADRWSVGADDQGLRYIMHDERLVEDGSPGGVAAAVATLSRVSLVSGQADVSFADVTAFSVIGDTLLYRKVAPGSAFPELHLRDAGGVDRLVGRSSGVSQFGGRGTFYAVLGDERTLSRLSTTDGTIEPLRAHVQRVSLSLDERYAVLGVVDAGRPLTLAFNMETKAELKIPGQPCCWLNLSELRGTPPAPSQWIFSYSESAHGEVPGKVHSFNLATGEDQILTLPAGLSEVSTTLGRPHSTSTLLVDGKGRIALFDATTGAPPRLLDLKPASPTFTSDGRFLIYVDPDVTAATPEGPLMVQDGDFLAPPRVLSPKGSSVSPGDHFFIGGAEPLVFWAHFGRSASDLYFSDPVAGTARAVARAIRQVTVTPRRVVGIIHISEQDLVGDLVRKDAQTGEERVLEYNVAEVSIGAFDAALGGARVAFVVRERGASKRDGLWATTLPP